MVPREYAGPNLKAASNDEPPVDLRTGIAHPARMYDYFLGGKDHFPADREAAERALAAHPVVREAARANRAWLGRAVRYAASTGIRQFLDIGTGIPTMGSTSEVAHEVAPDARIVYVDNDPIVLTHTRALLAHADGARRISVLQADLREPERILAEARAILDFDRPIALMLVAILHFVPDDDDPLGIVRSLLAELPAGSMLLLSHGTSDFATPEQLAGVNEAYRKSTAPGVSRSREELAALFAGLELVEPGIVQQPWWRPDGELPAGSEQIPVWAGVGVKP
ncbi:SAM-dependent methyltransferase [Streptomyces sp. NPDC092296]|uniref:SAM-dependent methyltransferase n=1 Tax=Streptomyces sp. NPDC092296 TaxID=3366012 RepID=UPI003830CC8C